VWQLRGGDVLGDGRVIFFGDANAESDTAPGTTRREVWDDMLAA
jgi:hypothetical protein